MSDILARICADKLAHVVACKARRSLEEVSRAAAAASPPRPFAASLAETPTAGYGLIAEIKRASPSRGVIRQDFDPAALAAAYERAGAACLSVLTDVPYFRGADEFLTTARAAAGLPVLRKDFMLDPYQIVEARALGADCVLIIMAALDVARAGELESASRELGMDVLIEVHDEAELERALALEARLIGVNNRNLKTLEVDLATTERLAARVPAGRIPVSESGLDSPDDLARMARAGVNCFLIGESLMRHDDVEGATRAILAAPQRRAARA
ncbi:MAG TPA: indole-3-glycerol phosphate synthase TrpC [Rhodospirillales bacterium]|nr:indole-3-glycerol phosphate synthase TrpC [Rhodospirillales bacterium]